MRITPRRLPSKGIARPLVHWNLTQPLHLSATPVYEWYAIGLMNDPSTRTWAGSNLTDGGRSRSGTARNIDFEKSHPSRRPRGGPGLPCADRPRAQAAADPDRDALPPIH